MQHIDKLEEMLEQASQFVLNSYNEAAEKDDLNFDIFPHASVMTENGDMGIVMLQGEDVNPLDALKAAFDNVPMLSSAAAVVMVLPAWTRDPTTNERNGEVVNLIGEDEYTTRCRVFHVTRDKKLVITPTPAEDITMVESRVGSLLPKRKPTRN